MLNNLYNPIEKSLQNPWILLLSLAGITLGGLLFLGQVMAFGSAIALYGVGIDDLISILTNPTDYPEYRPMILIVQGMSSIGGFIIAPLIFYYMFVKGNFLRDYFPIQPNIGNILLISIVIAFSFMMVNTVFIEWNANLSLPEAFSGIEQWASEVEESLKLLTEFLTEFDSTGYFILTIIVVAVVPGIGEELLFRGLLQNILLRIFKNAHVAIWVAAFLFSAVHFQFYGFLPRLLLGTLFGYMYVWTGNLLVPIVAHFLNNATSLLALYVYQKGLTDIDMESTDALPKVYIIIFSTLFVVSIVYLKNYLTKTTANE